MRRITPACLTCSPGILSICDFHTVHGATHTPPTSASTRLPNPWPGSALGFIAKLLRPGNTYGGSFIGGLLISRFVHEAAIDFDQNGNIEGTGFKSETFVGAPTTLPPFPAYEEDTTNRFQAVILDNGHVLDYVQFYGPVQVREFGVVTLAGSQLHLPFGVGLPDVEHEC